MTKAELKNNRWWVGSNSWNADLYSQDEAEKCAGTLKNCNNCFNCSSCSDCSDCSSCSYCSSCRSCRSCSDFKTDPQRVKSPILGSRKDQTTYYWNDENEQIVCGCFNGTLQQFKDKIKEKHGNNEFAKGYYKWIGAVEIYKNSLP